MHKCTILIWRLISTLPCALWVFVRGMYSLYSFKLILIVFYSALFHNFLGLSRFQISLNAAYSLCENLKSEYCYSLVVVCCSIPYIFFDHYLYIHQFFSCLVWIVLFFYYGSLPVLEYNLSTRIVVCLS